MKTKVIVVIVLTLPAICLAYLRSDLNYDRKVDFSDFAAFADQWLLVESPDEPNSIGLAAADYVIAASDTSARMKAKADYVCDGIDDNVEIQDAIDRLADGGGHRAFA